jgi:hypothetical protein
VMSTSTVLRGGKRARDRRLPVVGVWLAVDVDPAPLMEAGFTRGWSPWWMTGYLERRDPLQVATTKITWPHPAGLSYPSQDSLSAGRRGVGPLRPFRGSSPDFPSRYRHSQQRPNP